MASTEFREFYNQINTKLDRIRARIVSEAINIEKDEAYIGCQQFRRAQQDIEETLNDTLDEILEFPAERSDSGLINELKNRVNELLNFNDLLETGEAGKQIGISDLTAYGSPSKRRVTWSINTFNEMLIKAAPWILGTAAILLIFRLIYKNQ